MALTVIVVAGKTFAETEKLTIPKLNQLGQPSITVTGATTDFDDFSATAADTTGQGLVWDEPNGWWEPTTANSILGTHVAVMVGTDGAVDGTQGTVPQPLAENSGQFLRADATWATPPTNIGNILYMNEALI